MLYLLLLTISAFTYVNTSALEGLQERQSGWITGQQVETTSGIVSGHAANNSASVSEYLGIPYGQAPTGSLRFAAPVRFQGQGAVDGSTFGYSCPIRLTGSEAPTNIPTSGANVPVSILVKGILTDIRRNFSEDCLNLNVWTKPQVGEKRKAVLLWVHGGGFNTGTSSIRGYNGARLAADQDVVIVSINYRLSILGFPGNPNGANNNLGLQDTRLAVQWVRDNIEKFGGDAKRITIFGQSAGGAMVDLYSYAYVSNPIIAGIISQSGTVFAGNDPNAGANGAKRWFNVTSTLGCGNSASAPAEVLSCMRQKDFKDIMSSIPLTSGTEGLTSSFGPIADNTIVFSNYSTRTPAKIPLLIGSAGNEAGLYKAELTAQNVTLPDSFWEIFNQKGFGCPAGNRAKASLAALNPTWRYRYFGVFPNLAIGPDAGAWHASELPILFDTAPINPASTTAQVAIGKYLRGAWAAFAKDPIYGLTRYGWPSYNVLRLSLVRLAYENRTGTNVASPIRYDASCPLLENIDLTGLN